MDAHMYYKNTYFTQVPPHSLRKKNNQLLCLDRP